MSRCLSCGTPLSSVELTRKYSNWKSFVNQSEIYIGMCNSCCKKSGIKDWVDNPELSINDAPADPCGYICEESSEQCISYLEEEDYDYES